MITIPQNPAVLAETMTRVARLVHEHPALLPADAREVLEAFLLYRVADDSDMVYYDAVALVDELKPPLSVLEHLVGRARSPDPRERIEALVVPGRMRLGVYSTDVPDPPLAELLDDDDPDVQLALLQFLGQGVRYSWDAAELLPGVDLPAKLNPCARATTASDERRFATRTTWTSTEPLNATKNLVKLPFPTGVADNRRSRRTRERRRIDQMWSDRALFSQVICWTNLATFSGDYVAKPRPTGISLEVIP